MQALIIALFFFAFAPSVSLAYAKNTDATTCYDCPVDSVWERGREIIFWTEPFNGGVYRVIASEPYAENGEPFCGIVLTPMWREVATDYPRELARWPQSPIKIIVFPPNSEEPLHFFDFLDRFSEDCPLYEDMTVPVE